MNESEMLNLFQPLDITHTKIIHSQVTQLQQLRWHILQALRPMRN